MTDYQKRAAVFAYTLMLSLGAASCHATNARVLDNDLNASVAVPPPKNVDDLLRFKDALKSVATGGAAAQDYLRTKLVQAIVAQQGLPRYQIKPMLEDVLNDGAGCGGAACSDAYQTPATAVDALLDDLRQRIASGAMTLAAAQRTAVLGSLQVQAAGPTWRVTPLTGAEAADWQTASAATDNPDFPILTGDGVRYPLTPQLWGEVKWQAKHQEQLQIWKTLYAAVENCASRGRRLQRNLSVLAECLKFASDDDRQSLSAQWVYEEMEGHLQDPAKAAEALRRFRAVVDGDGRLQALVVVQHRPNVSKFRAEYPTAIPANAVQIPAMEVQYLMSAPWNLTKHDPKRVAGAGKAGLALAALESTRGEWRGRLFLESSPSAAGFYEKMGFTAFGEVGNATWGDLPVMWLTADAAARLLPDAFRTTAADSSVGSRDSDQADRPDADANDAAVEGPAMSTVDKAERGIHGR